MARDQTLRERLNIEGFANIPAMIERVFTVEVKQQEAIGKKPTLVLVDGGKGQQLHSVKRRAQAFFGTPEQDKARLRQAVHLAWDLLVRQTRVKTGAARASFGLYFRGRHVGDVGALDGALAKLAEGDLLVISGPGVPYGRKLYWRPTGRQKVIQRARRSRLRVKGGGTLRVITRTSYVEPMYRAVKRLIRRRFPMLYSEDKWRPIEHGGAPRGAHWPALALGIRFNRVK